MMIELEAKRYGIEALLARLRKKSDAKGRLPFGLTCEEEWLTKLASSGGLHGNDLAVMLETAVRMKSKQGFIHVLTRGDVSRLTGAIINELFGGVELLGWPLFLRSVSGSVDWDENVPPFCKRQALANIAAVVYLIRMWKFEFEAIYSCCYLREYGDDFLQIIMSTVVCKAKPEQLLIILVSMSSMKEVPPPPPAILADMLENLLEPVSFATNR